MKSLFKISIALLFLITSVAYAQPNKEYEAQKKKAADEKALQKYMDDRKPVTGSGASTSKYGFEIAHEKREREEEVARNKAARQVIEDEAREKREQKEAAVRDRRYKAEERIEQRQGPFREEMKRYGYFCGNSVETLVKRSSDDFGNLTAAAEQYRRVPKYYADYLAIRNTGSFEEVRDAIAKFDILIEEAFVAVTELGKRFPEQKKELAIATLDVFDHGRFSRSSAKEEQKREFERIYEEYPEEFFKRTWLEFGLFSYIYDIRDQKKPDVAKLLQLGKIFVIYSSSNDFSRNFYYNAAKYLNQLSDDELWQLAQTKGVSAARLAMNTSYYDNYFKLSKLKDSEYKDDKDYLTKAQSNRIKFFAYKGDPESGALYGVRILEGLTKEKKEAALPWLQKAVEDKIPFADENMKYICDYNVKAWKNTICK